MTDYNYLGRPISGKRLRSIELTSDPDYLWPDEEFKWPEDNGFDHNYNIAGLGAKVPIVFPKGKMFVRYGNPGGKLMADKGVPYEVLGLPYKKELKAYHEYILKETIVLPECGYIAPVFNSPGGVMQYFIKDGVQSLLKAHILDEDFTWLMKIRKKI